MFFRSDQYKEYVTYHLPLKKDTLVNGIINNSLEKGYSIEVTASSEFSANGGWTYYPKFIIDYKNKKNYYWHSNGNSSFGDYAQIEFKNQWIRPSGYVMVESNNVFKCRNWKITGSSDGKNFVTLDSQADNPIFTKDFQEEYFKINKRRRAFRFIRIVQTGKSYNGEEGSVAFRLGKIEIFGDSLVCDEANTKCLTNVPIFPNDCSVKMNYNHFKCFISFVLFVIC